MWVKVDGDTIVHNLHYIYDLENHICGVGCASTVYPYEIFIYNSMATSALLSISPRKKCIMWVNDVD